MGKHAAWFWGVVLGISTLASPSAAQESNAGRIEMSGPSPRTPLPEDPEYRQRTRWYGWQTLAADGAATALVFTSVSLHDGSGDAAAVFGHLAVLGYVAAPPLIHAVGHGSLDKALGSLTLRVVTPVAGAIVGLAVVPCESGGVLFCPAYGMGVGLLGGAVLASGIDAAFLARERVRDDAPAQLAFTPMLDVVGRPAGAGVRGTF